jgi:hypothetical protein
MLGSSTTALPITAIRWNRTINCVHVSRATPWSGVLLGLEKPFFALQ